MQTGFPNFPLLARDYFPQLILSRWSSYDTMVNTNIYQIKAPVTITTLIIYIQSLLHRLSH